MDTMDAFVPQNHHRVAGYKRAAGHGENNVKCVAHPAKHISVKGRAGAKQEKAAAAMGYGTRRAALGDVSNVLLQRDPCNARGKTANITKRAAQKPTSAAVGAAAGIMAMKKAKAKNAALRLTKEPRPQHDAAVSVEAKVFLQPAKPVQDWQDLDEPELNEPLTCAEYAPEIFQYLRELEPDTMPNPAYCELQKDMNHRMRDVLLDWMVEVHQSFKMIPETLYLAINILNRYLSLIQVPSNTLQLAGITSLFIAAKVEEIVIPEIKEFAYMADNAYPPEDIRRAERHMLQKINFRLSYPNPMNFLRRVSKADDYDTLSRTVGKYLLEIAIVDHRFMGFGPSLIAAGAMYLARHILNRGIWDATLAHYAGYGEEDILPVVSLMVAYISDPIHESLYKKYAGKKFSKVSVRVREWYQSRLNDRP